jgi:AAA+ ATPase superfamily predicted ATPase
MPEAAFEPIYPNPYIAGNPIRSQEMFFGRLDEFRFIARALEDGQKTALIVLFGERRSGKSSILYQILNGRLGAAFLPIFVDMQIMAGISSDAEFFGRIIADSCKLLARPGLTAERFLPKLEETTAANVFRQFLQELKSHFPERALLMLIDEYEFLEAKINEGSLSQHLLTFFAGLLETDLVSFVFTGSKSLEAHDRALWGEELFRKATSRKISFLTKDDTARLITQPLQNQAAFAPEVVAQIYKLTAGQPFYTQIICQELVYYLNEVQKRHVTLADLQTVVDRILENPPPQLLFNWGEHSAERKLALSLLAEFSEAPQTFLSVSDLCRGIRRKKLALDLDANFFHTELSSLAQDEYVLQKDHRQYAFRLDLYRRWVRHDHNIWQVKKEIGAKDIARLTKPARAKQEKKKRTFRRLEHAIAIGLAVVVIYVLWKLLFPPKHVIVQANGGPFWVLLNDDTVGTSKGQKDSTRFEMPEALTKGVA